MIDRVQQRLRGARACLDALDRERYTFAEWCVLVARTQRCLRDALAIAEQLEREDDTLEIWSETTPVRTGDDPDAL